jgi:hypothetical protein
MFFPYANSFTEKSGKSNGDHIMYPIKNIKLATAIFSALFIAVGAHAGPGVDATIDVTPIAGSATVDGDYAEWNLATDFAAKMCTAGSIDANGDCEGKGKVHLSSLYLRYDCTAGVMYVLVLREGDYQPDQSADDAWVTIDGNSNKVVKGNSGNDGTPPDFAWVMEGGELIGYEASFTISTGTYLSQVHLNVEGQTSSTGKNGDTIRLIVPEECDDPTPPGSKVSCDYIYGVDDDGLNDSQLLSYNGDDGIAAFGPPLPGRDIEALDISLDDILYGASGDDTDKPGFLYTFNGNDGSVATSFKVDGCNEIDGISFNPVTGNLWGWDQEQGLVQINIVGESCTQVLANPNGYEVEDLTWNNAGDVIYFTYNDHGDGDPDSGSDAGMTHIGKYIKASNTIESDICNIAVPEIEAIEMLNNGSLLMGYHNNSSQFVRHITNLTTCEMTEVQETEYTDIEGLASCLPKD